MPDLEEKLANFEKEHQIQGKGPLCVMLVITRRAKKKGLPLDPNKLLTKAGGQVSGLSKSNVQSVLKDYGITRVLAHEGGRTSRGSIQNMKVYSRFLNELNEKGRADLPRIEEWWINRVKKYFAGKPFKLRLDVSRSLRAVMADLLGTSREKTTRD